MRTLVTAERMAERIEAHFEDLAQELPSYFDLKAMAQDLADVFEQPFETSPEFLYLPYNQDILDVMKHEATDGELDIFVDEVLA